MSIVSWLLDLLYPPKCVVCRRLLTGKGPVCPRCMDALPEFDGAAPAVRFTSGGAVSFFYEGQLRESFLRFKFGGSAFYAQTYGGSREGAWNRPLRADLRRVDGSHNPGQACGEIRRAHMDAGQPGEKAQTRL